MTELLSNPFFATLAVLIGGVGLVVGGELLVRGATKIAFGLRISPLVVGLTVVAFCTSAPEMAVSFSAVLNKDPSVIDIALGNVVGSNICNILLILGVCALIRPLATSDVVVKRDFPVVVGQSLVTFIVAFLCIDASGERYLPRWFGFALLFAFVVYEYFTVRAERGGKNNANDAKDASKETAKDGESMDSAVSAAATRVNWGVAIFQTLFGLALLVGGAKAFVEGSVSIARTLGVSELIIGLTLVALGTSLPELTVSVIATCRNHVDVALGNVVGSNAFNLMLVLGGSITLLPTGLPVRPQSAYVDLPVMLVAAIAALLFCYTGRKISRLEGAVLLIAEFAYAGYLVM